MSDDLEAVLGTTPIFRPLSDRRRRRLAQHFCRRSYGAGDVVVRQGDTSLSFYVVLSGRVRIVRHCAGDAGDAGVDIDEEGPGSFFGEMGVLDDLPRAATVVALTDIECALLDKWDFAQALQSDPAIALALITVLHARIRGLEDRLARSGGA